MKAITTYTLVFVSAILMAMVVRHYYLETYLVQSISMNKTLVEGDKLLIIKSKNIKSGDILVFSHHQGTYVKRLIGLPGDTLQIKHQILYVNNKKKIEKYINIQPGGVFGERADPAIMNYYGVNWSVENFGPYVVPRKGSKIVLNSKNLSLYEDLLRKEAKSGTAQPHKLNQSYVFKKDYYFMLGDNRLFSEDSRMFGPLAKEDIIGKANYILFSENEIWRTLFKKI